MKRTIILVTAMLMMATANTFSQTPSIIEKPLNFSIINDDDHNNTGGSPLPKSPVQIPEVYLDGHTLSFDAAIEGCEVRLLDANENVIFTDFIEENQTLLILPSTLTGTFELQIIRGNIIFYCEIEL